MGISFERVLTTIAEVRGQIAEVKAKGYLPLPSDF